MTASATTLTTHMIKSLNYNCVVIELFFGHFLNTSIFVHLSVHAKYWLCDNVAAWVDSIGKLAKHSAHWRGCH